MAFLAERTQFSQAPIKLAQPFPAPELRAKYFTDTRILLIYSWGIKQMGFKMAVFLCFFWPGILVPVCFATRLGVLQQDPKGYQNGWV